MYIELEQDFKCRLIELFHYILRELLFGKKLQIDTFRFLNFIANKSV